MKPQERVLTAIRHEVPDRIPLAVIDIENELEVAAFLGINHPEMLP